MYRKNWMLPKRDAIGRSLTLQPTGRTAEGRRKTKRAMTLLVCAAALTLLAGAVLMAVGGGKEMFTVPGIQDVEDDIPDPPFMVVGYTYADGGTKLPNCDVTITNVNTGLSATVSSGAISFYSYDISLIGYTVGDTIHVEAVNGGMFGENEGVIAGGSYMSLNITLNQTIPEFPVLLAAVGMLALFTVVGVRRRRSA